jgi:hypothetical protein
LGVLTSLPIPSVLSAEVVPAGQYSYKYSSYLLMEHTEFSTNLQADIINNISAQNVNTGPNYGLLHLDHHISLLSLIF